MECVICGTEMEPWPGGSGYGNNPDPWPTPQAAAIMYDSERYRCCDDCNALYVIPLRLAVINRG